MPLIGLLERVIARGVPRVRGRSEVKKERRMGYRCRPRIAAWIVSLIVACDDDGPGSPDASTKDSGIHLIILRRDGGSDAAVASDGGKDASIAADSGAQIDASSASDASTSADAAADASTASDASTRDAGPALVCGTTTCAPLEPIPNGPTVTACCYNGGGSSVCSGRITNGQCNRPAVPDSECVDISVMGNLLQGCCASSGRCGLDGNLSGIGCQSLEDAESYLDMIGVDIPQGAKRPCN